jgi:LAO/AO transport system kinase
VTTPSSSSFGPASGEQRLLERLLAGDKGALARLISWAENSDPRYPALMRELQPRLGQAWRIGVTGPPGAGKSTLVNELTRELRKHDRKVGVLAVDPSSPFTGGALLGDRIRMEERTIDAGVYIRSMASRGSHGGIARAAVDACDAIDAAGYAEAILETVGVGQAEYDVVTAADTVLVVLCPGAGDGIQAMKAGILEVADVLVVNKSDLPGAERLVLDLEEAVHIRATGGARRTDDEWSAPVVMCSAGTARGLDLVLAQIERHREWLRQGRLESMRAAKRLAHVRRVAHERLDEELFAVRGWEARARTELAAGKAPWDVVEGLLGSILDRG